MTQIADRIFLSLLTLIVVGSSVLSQDTTNFWLAEQGGRSAAISLLALLVLAVVALIDTIVNDLLPEKYHFAIGIRLRQAIWMWIGVTFVGYAFVRVRLGVELWLACLYILCGIRAAMIAFLDLRESMEGQRRDRRASDLQKSSTKFEGGIHV